MTKARAIENGLKFTGDYSSNKEDVVSVLKTYRDSGIRCAIVAETFRGKIKASAKTGYSLFAERELD